MYLEMGAPILEPSTESLTSSAANTVLEVAARTATIRGSERFIRILQKWEVRIVGSVSARDNAAKRTCGPIRKIRSTSGNFAHRIADERHILGSIAWAR